MCFCPMLWVLLEALTQAEDTRCARLAYQFIADLDPHVVLLFPPGRTCRMAAQSHPAWNESYLLIVSPHPLPAHLPLSVAVPPPWPRAWGHLLAHTSALLGLFIKLGISHGTSCLLSLASVCFKIVPTKQIFPICLPHVPAAHRGQKQLSDRIGQKCWGHAKLDAI